MKKIIIVIAFLLAGCAQQMYWYKSGSTQAEFNQDRYQCQMDAAQAYPSQMMQTSYGTGYRTNSYTDCSTYWNRTSCTTTPGQYVPPPTMMVDANARNRNQIFNSCMEARGYSLRPREQSSADTQRYDLQCFVQCRQNGGALSSCQNACPTR